MAEPLLTLSVQRVEVRLYRSSRTSSDISGRPPHFMYCIQCKWSPGRGGKDPEDWWRPLPSGYTVKRRWADICQFHQLLRHLAHDPEVGCSRVKAKLPDLPNEGELDQFVNGIAATGDASAMCRPDSRDHRAARSMLGVKDREPAEELDDIHRSYVENRLGPYFADATKVICELPLEVLRASPSFRKFVSSSLSLPRTSDPLEAELRFMGPSPLLLDRDVAKGVTSKVRSRSQAKAGRQAAQEGGPTNEEGAARGEERPLPPIGRRSRVLAGAACSQSAQLAQSLSEPSLKRGNSQESAVKFGLSADRPLTRQQKKDHRLQSSHYGFFAKVLQEADSAGGSSGRDYWKKMVQKERKELGRRSMHRDSSWMSSSTCIGRLPALPPGVSTMSSVDHPSHSANSSTWSPLSTKGPARPVMRKISAVMSRDAAVAQIRENLCEGLRVLILQEKPHSVPRHMRKMTADGSYEGPMPSEEETLKVYEFYCKLLQLGGGRGGYLDSLQGEESRGAEDSSAHAGTDIDFDSSWPPNDGACPGGLPYIVWQTLFAWAQHREDIAFDFRYKSATALLNRSLQAWTQTVATEGQKETGMPLSLLFKWVWPSVTHEHLATMFCWVYLRELESIRQPTPRVMDPHDRRILGKIWATMDPQGKGHCTADDIAGANEQGISAKMRSIVDTDTVRAVAGEGVIDELRFLELMCEDNFRAHETATRVNRQDGNILVLQHCKVVDARIWILEDPSEEEVSHRKLLEAIEAEIRCFRERAEVRAAQEESSGSSELIDIENDEEFQDLIAQAIFAADDRVEVPVPLLAQ